MKFGQAIVLGVAGILASGSEALAQVSAKGVDCQVFT